MQPSLRTVLETLWALANCLPSQVPYHSSKSLFIKSALYCWLQQKLHLCVLHLRYRSVTPIPTERKTLQGERDLQANLCRPDCPSVNQFLFQHQLLTGCCLHRRLHFKKLNSHNKQTLPVHHFAYTWNSKPAFGDYVCFSSSMPFSSTSYFLVGCLPVIAPRIHNMPNSC